jgi:hypothetical protein
MRVFTSIARADSVRRNDAGPASRRTLKPLSTIGAVSLTALLLGLGSQAAYAVTCVTGVNVRGGTVPPANPSTPRTFVIGPVIACPVVKLMPVTPCTVVPLKWLTAVVLPETPVTHVPA